MISSLQLAGQRLELLLPGRDLLLQLGQPCLLLGPVLGFRGRVRGLSFELDQALPALWDRTLLYVASDFGRSKGRPANAEDFGTAHDLNDGVLLVSPLVRGKTPCSAAWTPTRA